MAKKVQAQQATEAEVAKARAEVKAATFVKALNLDWVLERPIEEGDITALSARVAVADNGTEWASWWMPYKRADGTAVPGINWGVSAPIAGGFLILRLVEGGKARAKLSVWSSGKGILEGEEAIVKALRSRPDLPPWSTEDTASLL